VPVGERDMQIVRALMRTGGLGGLLERVARGQVLTARCGVVARLDQSTGRPDWLRGCAPVGSAYLFESEAGSQVNDLGVARKMARGAGAYAPVDRP
jgi:hypothetical protein